MYTFPVYYTVYRYERKVGKPGGIELPNNALHPKLSVAARCSALCADSVLFIVPLLDEWLTSGKGEVFLFTRKVVLMKRI